MIRPIIRPIISSLSINSASIKSTLSTKITNKILYNYHMSYLMDSKYDDRYVKIDRRAFHLYRDSLLNFPSQPFNQKIFLIIIIDAVRTKQKYQDFQQLTQYGLSHLNQFKQIISIFNFASQLYLYNYPHKEKAYLLAKKGFQLIKKHSTANIGSYYVMKFLIFIEKNVGLQRFTDQDYKLINYPRFKPLFLCFTLEMFYTNNLQHYKTVQYIFELFTSSESMIPFVDIHHYRKATKIITNPKYKEFVDKLNTKLADKANNDIQINEKDEQENFKQNEQSDQMIMGKQNSIMNSDKKSVQNTDNNTNNQQYVYPWQKAYAKHLMRKFQYYPSISYSTESKTQVKKQ